MTIENLLKKRNMTKYRLAVDAGIPHATLNDICSGKTRLEKCSAETVYKLAKALEVSADYLLTGDIVDKDMLLPVLRFGLPTEGYEYIHFDNTRKFGSHVFATVRPCVDT